MTYLDSTDTIARVRKQARIQGQMDFPTDPQLFEWSTDGENFVKAIVATYCPRAPITAARVDDDRRRGPDLPSTVRMPRAMR